MFIIRFGGGLGNQLYQYAFAMYLHNRYPNIELLYDAGSYLLNNEHNGFDLPEYFNFEMKKAEDALLEKIIPCEMFNRKHPRLAHTFLGKIIRVCIRRKKLTPNCYIIEDTPVGTFDRGIQKIENADQGVFYFKGGYQNIGYYKNMFDELLQYISFRTSIKSEECVILDKIKKDNALCIHIRRGDYVGTRFDVVTERYYRLAYEKMKEICKTKCTVFVFSDDIEYAKEVLKFIPEEKEYVYNSKCGFELYYMSKCKKYILSNSTFAFWGAFLNPSEDKIVICPRYMFKYNSMVYETSVPEKWIRICEKE